MFIKAHKETVVDEDRARLVDFRRQLPIVEVGFYVFSKTH